MPEVRLGVVRGISFGLFGKPDEFVPAARALGAGLLRVYVYWAQVEPEPGRYEWGVVDALLAQLDGDEEVWVTVCSSSPWATRQPTNFLPPSPAHDLGAYAEFTRRLVGHCAGRVRYWQCDNEPSNTALLWAGTAQEYVTQLRAFHGAVKQVDASASVVLGGCGYDVFSAPEDGPAREFFRYLVDAGRDCFDLFDVHLYGEPHRVPEYVAAARSLMRGYGYEKPVVAGEHAGPVLFEFPEVEPVIQGVFLAAFADAPATQSTTELAERAGQDTPERTAMRALYERADSLPPRLRMLMAGGPPELSAKRDRIACRQLAVRTVLALECGIRRLAYWSLAPEVPGPVDPYQMMHLMFGRLPLLHYDGTELTRGQPAADTFALLAERLAGCRAVTRLGLNAVQVDRDGRGPLLVVWDRRDWFDGEDQPGVPVASPWSAPEAPAVDVFGRAYPTRVVDGRVELTVTDTPVLVG